MNQSEAAESIHGHEIMQMIVDGAGTISESDLAAKVQQKYGPDARFHTCSIQNATLTELIELLKSKGKTVLKDGFLFTEASQICNH